MSSTDALQTIRRTYESSITNMKEQHEKEINDLQHQLSLVQQQLLEQVHTHTHTHTSMQNSIHFGVALKLRNEDSKLHLWNEDGATKY